MNLMPHYVAVSILFACFCFTGISSFCYLMAALKFDDQKREYYSVASFMLFIVAGCFIIGTCYYWGNYIIPKLH